MPRQERPLRCSPPRTKPRAHCTPVGTSPPPLPEIAHAEPPARLYGLPARWPCSPLPAHLLRADWLQASSGAQASHRSDPHTCSIGQNNLVLELRRHPLAPKTRSARAAALQQALPALAEWHPAGVLWAGFGSAPPGQSRSRQSGIRSVSLLALARACRRCKRSKTLRLTE